MTPRPRSVLFVPAAKPRMVAKAPAVGADEVVLDLEDGVDASDRPMARSIVAEALDRQAFAEGVSVRLNPIGGAACDDIHALAPVLDRARRVWLPKVQTADELIEFEGGLLEAVGHRPGASVGERSRPALVALVETAQAVAFVDSIARAPVALSALALGRLDLSAELGVPELRGAGASVLLGYLRCRVSLAAHAHGLEAIDGPWLELDDLAGLTADAAAARLAGMTGKLCVHPKQVSVCADEFRVSAEQREWALAVQDAGGAEKVGGEMVDVASARLAARVLDLVEAHGVRS